LRESEGRRGGVVGDFSGRLRLTPFRTKGASYSAVAPPRAWSYSSPLMASVSAPRPFPEGSRPRAAASKRMSKSG
jgi:hypothetical protein